MKNDQKIFAQNEIDEIYDSAVNALECSYRGDYEDIDIANEPVEKFDLYPDRVLVLQSIIKKIGGEKIE